MNFSLRSSDAFRTGSLWLRIGVFLLAVSFHLPFLFSGWGGDSSFFLERVPAFENSNFLPYLDPKWGWYYRPVFLFYFAAIRTVFGDNPVAFHAVAIVLHGLVACLVTEVARALKTDFPELIGATFAILTLRNQAPGWIAGGGSSVLAALCVLGALWFWIRFARAKPSRQLGFYGCSLGCLVIGLGCKEEVAALPLILFGIDIYCRPNVLWNRRFISFLPMILIFPIYLYLSLIAHHHSTYFHTDSSFEPWVAIPLINTAFGNAFGFWHPILSVTALCLVFWRAWRYPTSRLAIPCLVVLTGIIACSVGSYVFIGDGTWNAGSRFSYLSSVFAAFVLTNLFLSIEERSYKSHLVLWISVFSFVLSLPFQELLTNPISLQISVMIFFLPVAWKMKGSRRWAWWQIGLCGAFLSTFPIPAIPFFLIILGFTVSRIQKTNLVEFFSLKQGTVSSR